MSTDDWGIDHRYLDALEVWRDAPQATIAAIRAAMGAAEDGRTEPPISPVQVVIRGVTTSIGPGRLVFEHGGEVDVLDRLPEDVPLGYHRFEPANGGNPRSLIVSPGKCLLPPPEGVWGWSAQLYAARSRESWGIGDLADLRRLGRWSKKHGAALTLVNPLHATSPTIPQENSPYYPSTRRFRNPLYLRIEEIAGAFELGDELTRLATAGQALNAKRTIDRNEVFRLKMAALEAIFAQQKARITSSSDFQSYCHEQGQALKEFATFCVLAERHGKDWRTWPEEFRQPQNPAVVQVARVEADRVDFFRWLQWLLELQLAEATRDVPVVQDLPVGVDPGGADAWAWQDILALNMSVGCPPDVYNTRGQNWGLPPWIAHKLQAAAYQPFIETLRATLRYAGGLRIDHVLGLFRLFWIPYGATPREGTFVRYPADEMLAIIALESHRAGAYIVGEDLGTVESNVIERLANHRLLSYRVVWFEKEAPPKYSALSLAAVSTHDLPTIAGIWSGSDLADQQRIGQQPDAKAVLGIRTRLQGIAEIPGDAPVEKVVVRAHELLAAAPSLIVTPMLDDALAVQERPNMPGTIDQWPNWRIALPLPLEEIETSPLANQVGQCMAKRIGRKPAAIPG